MISHLTFSKVGLVIGAWAAFYFGMVWANGLRDLSAPPDIYDLAVCERARLNARKAAMGEDFLDTKAHRWTIDGCRDRGFRTE